MFVVSYLRYSFSRFVFPLLRKRSRSPDCRERGGSQESCSRRVLLPRT